MFHNTCCVLFFALASIMIHVLFFYRVGKLQIRSNLCTRYFQLRFLSLNSTKAATGKQLSRHELRSWFGLKPRRIDRARHLINWRVMTKHKAEARSLYSPSPDAVTSGHRDGIIPSIRKAALTVTRGCFFTTYCS